MYNELIRDIQYDINSIIDNNIEEDNILVSDIKDILLDSDKKTLEDRGVELYAIIGHYLLRYKGIVDRESKLLNELETYILTETENSYSNNIDIFKKIGYTETELIKRGIRDLDFELESGLISEEEYEKLTERYEV